SGQSRMTGGTLTLTTDVIANLVLAGGNLVVSDTFQGGTITNLTLGGVTLASTNTVTGTLNWTGGSISGSLTVAGSGALNISGDSPKYLYGPLTNYGTVAWSGSGSLVVENSSCYGFSGLIENMAGALWDIQSDQTVYNDYYYCG